MIVIASYGVQVKGINAVLRETLEIYRMAVDFIINVILENRDDIESIDTQKRKYNYIEHLIHKTKKNDPKYRSFDRKFYKMPIYIMRAAIADAYGLVRSYGSNAVHNKKAGRPHAGNSFPAMYRGNMYKRIDDHTAMIKVRVRNTWDWLTVKLDKGDVDYIKRHCGDMSECVPYLTKRGKRWYLRYAFKKKISLAKASVDEQVVIACDLGINRACVCSAMLPDGTVIGRHYLKLPKEKDCLEHAVNRIKKAQKARDHKTPRLWAKANGINKDIASKTAAFIAGIADMYDAYAVVFEHLDLRKKKKGSKKQRLALWRARYVQSIVTHKAHMLGIHISHVNAWRTSALAYDGSGPVSRDEHNHTMCTFKSGKRYDCDLSASYNIGARYFIREILKTLTARARSALEAKVPHVAGRSTCTLSDLISLSAEIERLAA